MGAASGGASSDRGLRPTVGRGAGRLGKSPVPVRARGLGARVGCARVRHEDVCSRYGQAGQPFGGSLALASVSGVIPGVTLVRMEPIPTMSWDDVHRLEL